MKGGFGFFTQPPQFQESSPAFGNPHLKPTHTIHAGGGFDYTIVPGVKFGIEGFYKYLYDRIIGTVTCSPDASWNGASRVCRGSNGSRQAALR